MPEDSIESVLQIRMEHAQQFYIEHGFLVVSAYEPAPFGTIIGPNKLIRIVGPDGDIRIGRSTVPLRIVDDATREDMALFRVAMGTPINNPLGDYIYKVEVVD